MALFFSFTNEITEIESERGYCVRSVILLGKWLRNKYNNNERKRKKRELSKEEKRKKVNRCEVMQEERRRSVANVEKRGRRRR